MNEKAKQVVCPKCKSTNLRVFCFNSKSYCNDYFCKKCENVFSYSTSRDKIYSLSQKRKEQITCNEKVKVNNGKVS